MAGRMDAAKRQTNGHEEAVEGVLGPGPPNRGISEPSLWGPGRSDRSGGGPADGPSARAENRPAGLPAAPRPNPPAPGDRMRRRAAPAPRAPKDPRRTVGWAPY